MNTIPLRRTPAWQLLLLGTLVSYGVQVVCEFAVGAAGALWNPTLSLSALIFAAMLLLCIEPLLRRVDTPAIAIGIGSSATALLLIGVLGLERWMVHARLDAWSVGHLALQTILCGIAYGVARVHFARAAAATAPPTSEQGR